jgi:hypothetical protein
VSTLVDARERRTTKGVSAMTRINELLSMCPFCGKPPKIARAPNAKTWWIIECASGECDVIPRVEMQGKQLCIDAWNKRPEEERQAGVIGKFILEAATIEADKRIAAQMTPTQRINMGVPTEADKSAMGVLGSCETLP